MKIDVEKAKAEAASGGLLPEGEYVMRIADASEGLSSNGNEMITLDLVVSGSDWKGAEVRDWITPMKYPGSVRFPELLDAVGLPYPESGDFAPDSLIGLRCRGEVYHSPGKTGDRKFANVSAYKPIQPTDPDDPLAVPPAAVASHDDSVPF